MKQEGADFSGVTHYTHVDVQPGGINIQNVEHLYQADILKQLGVELAVKQKVAVAAARTQEAAARTQEAAARTQEAAARTPLECMEKLTFFVHPSVDVDEQWQVHNEIVRLVACQGIQEICKYLSQLSADKKVLLPQNAEKAYNELVRLGMPDGEGYSLKTFTKYYKR